MKDADDSADPRRPRAKLLHPLQQLALRLLGQRPYRQQSMPPNLPLQPALHQYPWLLHTPLLALDRQVETCQDRIWRVLALHLRWLGYPPGSGYEAYPWVRFNPRPCRAFYPGFVSRHIGLRTSLSSSSSRSLRIHHTNSCLLSLYA